MVAEVEVEKCENQQLERILYTRDYFLSLKDSFSYSVNSTKETTSMHQKIDILMENGLSTLANNDARLIDKVSE
jgi:hypothetical protein